jgi:hypothetical protein
VFETSDVISNEVRNLSSLKRHGIERSLAALEMTAEDWVHIVATLTDEAKGLTQLRRRDSSASAQNDIYASFAIATQSPRGRGSIADSR